MPSLLTALGLSTLVAAAGAADVPHWFKQTTDHFGMGTATFMQRSEARPLGFARGIRAAASGSPVALLGGAHGAVWRVGGRRAQQLGHSSGTPCCNALPVLPAATVVILAGCTAAGTGTGVRSGSTRATRTLAGPATPS